MYADILILKIFLEPTGSEDKQSSVMLLAEIESVSHIDCSSRIPLNTVQSKQPEPCPIDQNIASTTNPQLDLDENVPVNIEGTFYSSKIF